LRDNAWIGKAMQPRYDRGTITPRMLGIACKITATDTAFRVACDGMQIFGAAANDTRHPIEKLMRDARASLIEDGTNEVLALVASEDLRHW
ncbi:MAG TPA: acyl-CoA dehydrogenase family protein, partial [Polyangiales bacterium]